ncbi:DUF6308 family protein [Kineosporia succinea]|uniref:Uncharacterized protein n=1 Tax=Kineosporia succinea TaxID=84632 RepID=A0ABT9PAZ7_9ACTN|nr:DUF6308 family protein [Kineosporia succinea]MDP9829871.1 hypothetical protein [Kineosporia succinea]
MAASALRIGRFSVSVVKAETWVRQYTADTGRPRYAYPAYEDFRSGTRSGPLEDADLLAPVLLNAKPTLEAYYWLQSQLPALNQALERIPEDASLTDASLSPDLLEPLFGVLDGNTRWGVRMTTLSKVLHRKRPGFIPLWDGQVRACYYGTGAPVPPVQGRGSGAFAVAVATALREDLTADAETWAAVAALATEPAITPLRALDIVAWNLGAQGETVPVQTGSVPVPRP